MPVNGFGWHRRPAPPTSDELVAATRDYYLHTIDQFGPRRCMFESNFPVDRVSCSYAVLWNAFKKIAAGFTADEKAQLFRRTAAEVYRLKLPALSSCRFVRVERSVHSIITPYLRGRRPANEAGDLWHRR